MASPEGQRILDRIARRLLAEELAALDEVREPEQRPDDVGDNHGEED
jgi:hypothetical protein